MLRDFVSGSEKIDRIMDKDIRPLSIRVKETVKERFSLITADLKRVFLED